MVPFSVSLLLPIALEALHEQLIQLEIMGGGLLPGVVMLISSVSERKLMPRLLKSPPSQFCLMRTLGTRLTEVNGNFRIFWTQSETLGFDVSTRFTSAGISHLLTAT